MGRLIDIKEQDSKRDIILSHLKTKTELNTLSPDLLMTLRPSIVFLVDYYKHSHSKMYMPDVVKAMSYGESRGVANEHKDNIDTMIWGGLQYYIKRYLSGIVVTKADVDYVEVLCKEAFGGDYVFDRTIWDSIIKDFGGKLPLEIYALPEGLRVKPHTVLFRIESTVESYKYVSLVSFIETLIQNVWYPSTVLTLDFYAHEYMRAAYRKSVDDDQFESYKYMINDFGVRGTSCPEEATIGGSMHLLLSLGSDNVPAHSSITSIYPKSNKDTRLVATVPATEHFVVTLLGKIDEYKVFGHCLNVYPKGIISMVSDGFNIFNAISNIYGETLAKEVTERDGTLVIRLDSGAPIPTILTALRLLEEKFGSTKNEKGYKVLPPFVRIMQSDGINYTKIADILVMMMENGWAANNIVFGYGGDLLRKMNRDTLKFAIKCCQVTRNIDGELVDVDVQKEPYEMNENYEIVESFKKSKKGKYKTINYNGDIISVPANDEKYKDYEDLLRIVFTEGAYYEYNFEEVRDLIEGQYRN